MKINLVIVTFLLCNTILYSQESKIEKLKKHLTQQYVDLEIDYNKEYNVKELNTSSKSFRRQHYISSKFAIYLFNNQSNQFQFKNQVLLFNNKPINLFEDFDTIKNNFPDKTILIDTSNSVKLANGVWLKFTDFKNKKYLVNIDINLKLLYDKNDTDFGIFLYDGFPLNGAWYCDNDFQILLKKLNKNLERKFTLFQSYTYATKFQNVDLKNIEILDNYFTDKERFERTKNKVIKNNIIMRANGIIITNQLTYDGIDPELIPKEAPDISPSGK